MWKGKLAKSATHALPTIGWALISGVPIMAGGGGLGELRIQDWFPA